MLFEKPGKENTAVTVQLALEEAKKRGIKHIVVASITGETAKHLLDAKGFDIAVVTTVYGYPNDINGCRTPMEVRKELESAGMTVITAGHALSSVERALSTKFSGIYPIEIMAHTLRMFGAGVKVCVECATMAADAGAVPIGAEVMCIAGTGGGADAAVVLKAAPSHRILETKIVDIICKPHL